jgi:hypothetical protein
MAIFDPTFVLNCVVFFADTPMSPPTDDVILGLDVGQRAIYMTGWTDGDFPVWSPPSGPPVSPIQGAYAGGASDAFLAVADMGCYPLYSDYYGGPGADIGHDIAVFDGQNTLASCHPISIVGSTTTGITPVGNAFQPLYGGGSSDGFIMTTRDCIDNTIGVAAATNFGGTGHDEIRGIEIGDLGVTIQDPFHHITGFTDSTTGFPLTADAFQPTYGGGASDAFMAIHRFGLPAPLIYSSYHGGSQGDRGLDITLVINPYMPTFCGDTASLADFPLSGPPFQGIYGGGPTDAFVAAQGPGGIMPYSSYFGGLGTDVCWGIDGWPFSPVMAAGGTDSAALPLLGIGGFPVTPGAFQGTNQGGFDAFAMSINIWGSGPGSLLWSSYLGGSGDDIAYDVAESKATADTAIIGGGTTAGAGAPFPAITPYPTNGGAEDGFLSVLSCTGPTPC